MTRTPRHRPAPRRAIAAAGWAMMVAGVGVPTALAVLSDDTRPAAPPPKPSASDTLLPPAPVARKRPRVRYVRRSRPVRIEIPEVGLRAPIVPVGLDGHHALQVPHDWGTAGWWKDGARPGERGPAVIVGHVDSTTGPAVFYRVPGLRRGSRIRIVRRDGSVIHFTVTGIAQYAKTRFPTARVYGATRRPTLRLITCSGTFDRSTGHYLDNTIVVAVHR